MQSLLLYLHYNSISAHHQHHCHTWLGKLYHRPHSLVVLINNLEFLHSIFTQCYLLGNLCHLCCSSTCTVLLYTFRNFIFCISYTTHHIQHSVTSDPPGTRQIPLDLILFCLFIFGIYESRSDAVPVQLLYSYSVSVSESEPGTISACTV